MVINASHAQAAEAERVALRLLTPQERLDRTLDLIARHREGLGEAGKGFVRVVRIVSHEQSR
ncbi:MAG: hypothetical protein V4813_11715 [Gemmatimonadota bacterium]